MTGNEYGGFVEPWRRTGRIAWLGLVLALGAVPCVQAQQGPYGPNPFAQPYPQPFTRSNYNPYNGNGNGITYYYVQNPNGPNYYPFASQFPAPAPAGGAPTRTPTWPAPATPASQSQVAAPLDPSIGTPDLDGRKPTVSFHRQPDDCFWFNADYVATFMRPMRTPALVTLGSLNDVHQGALGQPSTLVVYGNNGIDFKMFSGVRLQGGLFLDSCDRFSLDIGGFLNGPNTQSFSLASDANGNPLIARPIFNVAESREGAFLTSAPGNLGGTVSIDSKSEMSGLELNFRYHNYLRERLHVDGLFGFRYLRLAESMRFQDQLNPLAANFLEFNGNSVNAPNSLTDQDSFRTVNQFFGPQVGGRVSWENRWVAFEGFAKLGLGITQQQTDINGSTTLITPAGNQTAAGGILAQPSNIGTYNRAVFGIVPEFGLQFSVELTRWLRLHMGYSLLMWDNVVRPGMQIDRNVNPTQAPGSQTFGTVSGPLSPAYRFSDEFFWSHSFNIGLEFHY